MRNRAALLVAACLVALGGCTSDEPVSSAPGDGDRFTVVTDLYPTTFAVEQVVGDDVDVIQLAPAGVEPHDYELTPAQVAQVADADLVFHLPGMVPAVQAAIDQVAPDRGVDVAADVTRLTQDGSADPHVWLDPRNVASMAGTAADALEGAGITANAADVTERMTALDQDARAALTDCAITPMVVSHEAFGYLANAYGFEQVGISGLSPDAEPSPKRLAEIAQLVRDSGVTTIYFEELASPKAAQTIAAETGANTALLDPIEGNTDDAGYEQIMRTNIETLRTGQGCAA